jgi:hypothetical protein
VGACTDPVEGVGGHRESSGGWEPWVGRRVPASRSGCWLPPGPSPLENKSIYRGRSRAAGGARIRNFCSAAGDVEIRGGTSSLAPSLPTKKRKKRKEAHVEAAAEAVTEAGAHTPPKKLKSPKKQKGASRTSKGFDGTTSAPAYSLKALMNQDRVAEEGGDLSTPPPEGSVAQKGVRKSEGQEQASPSKSPQAFGQVLSGLWWVCRPN